MLTIGDVSLEAKPWCTMSFVDSICVLIQKWGLNTQGNWDLGEPERLLRSPSLFSQLKGHICAQLSFLQLKVPVVLVWLKVWMCGVSTVQNRTSCVVSFQSFVDQNCSQFRDSSNSFVCKREELFILQQCFGGGSKSGLTDSVNVTRTKCRCHVHLMPSPQDSFQGFT